jgi:hypothetical protein
MKELTFKMDTSAMKQWAEAWKQFPWESGKYVAKMVNNMCFQFRDDFFKVKAAKYTIRDQAFIKRTITIEKARPRSHMADIVAVIGTWQGKTGKTFSGYEEELTGREPTDSKPKRRVILPAGRKGKTMAGKAQPWARMNPRAGRIPSIIDLDAGLQNVPEEHRFAAMIRMMAAGKIPHSPSNTFILEGGKYKAGLYRFRGGRLPVKEDFKRGKKRVEMLQVFKDKPILPPRWDWQGMVEEKVKTKFTPEYIFVNYISKAIEAAMKKNMPKNNIDTSTGSVTLV